MRKEKSYFGSKWERVWDEKKRESEREELGEKNWKEINLQTKANMDNKSGVWKQRMNCKINLDE